MRAASTFIVLFIISLCMPLHSLFAEQMPLRVQMVLTKAYKLMEQEDYGKAIAVINEFRARSDHGGKDIHDHPQINLTLGNCLSLKGQFDKAAAAYQRVLKRDEDNISAWQNLGRCEYELKHLEKAGSCFLKAYELSEPPRADMLYQAAAAQLMAGNNKQSIALFERLLKAHPGEIELEWKEALVYALFAVDQNKRALPYIRDLAAGYEGKKQRQWREILLQQYLGLNMYTSAKTLAIQLTRLEPDEALWWKCLAHVYLQQDQPESALQALTIYRYLTPLSLDEKKLLADLHLQLGVPVQSIPDYTDYLKEKSDLQIVKRLVHAYMEMGQMEKAQETLAKYDTKGKREDLTMLRAEILYGLKRYPEAAAVFRKVATTSKKDKTLARAWMMQGYCWWQKEEIDKSLIAFRKAANYKRYSKEAGRIIKQLEQQKMQTQAVQVSATVDQSK